MSVLRNRIADMMNLSPEVRSQITKEAMRKYPGHNPDDFNRLMNAAKKNNLNVIVGEIPPTIDRQIRQQHGSYGGRIAGVMAGDGTLYLSPTLDKGRSRTLSHELGHWDRGHRYRTMPRGIQELEAESIAFGIAHRLGVPVDVNADMTAAYIARHMAPHQGMNPIDVFSDSLPGIRESTDRILRWMDYGNQYE